MRLTATKCETMPTNTLKQFDLTGQVALISGGNRGLGLEMAKALADAGCNVAITARDAERNQKAVAELRAYAEHLQFMSHECDVTREDMVKEAVEAVGREMGRIDILINSAGINTRGSIDELSLEQFEWVQKVNVTGSWLMCREVLPYMRKNGYGRIMNIGSMLSIIAIKDRTPYASSKGAVLQLTRALSLEVAKENITVNTLMPGPFATEMNLVLTEDPEKYRAFIANIPMGRWGEMHEIRGITLFLCSPASSYVTGAGFSIDGGWTVR